MSSSPSNPILSQYHDFQNRTPYFCRALLHALVFAYLSTWIIDLSPLLTCTPAHAIGRMQIYQFATWPLWGNSLLTIVFSCMIFMQTGPQLEYSLGSAGLASLLLVITLVTGLTFSILCNWSTGKEVA